MDKKLIVICGDAIEKMSELPDKSIELITTDPPYNLNKDYGSYQDNLTFNEYLDFSRQWLSQAKRILKDDGLIYLFTGVRYISYLYVILEQELNMCRANPGKVWQFSHVHYCNENRSAHPIQKPEGLFERMNRLSDNPNNLKQMNLFT